MSVPETAQLLGPETKMPRGKPLWVGPTARLAEGMTWDVLAEMSADEIEKQGVFPYPSLPHPLQPNGGQVFPNMQLPAAGNCFHGQERIATKDIHQSKIEQVECRASKA